MLFRAALASAAALLFATQAIGAAIDTGSDLDARAVLIATDPSRSQAARHHQSEAPDPPGMASTRAQARRADPRPVNGRLRSPSLTSLVSEIRETLPPLGGVCNAAMVLTDKLFVDMDVASVDRHLQGPRGPGAGLVHGPALFALPPTADVNEKKDGPQYGRDDIKKQVQDAETEDGMVAVVQEAPCAKIETMLQLPTGSVDTDSPLTQLGIDSLVAVEMRAWFLNNIGIDDLCVGVADANRPDAAYMDTVGFFLDLVPAHRHAYPERIAARDRSSDLTYEQLAARVNSIAAAIQTAGHATDSCIAVLCEPSNDFVASLLAILHIGAVYVPLDIGLPASRHTDMISSCHPSLIICHETTRDAADTLVGENPESTATLALEDIDHARDPVLCAAKPDCPAFIFAASPAGDLIAHGILDPGKKGEDSIDQGTIKRKLLTGLTLPQYMHPSRVIIVEDLPRASTGKIDRQAVLKMPLSASGDGVGGEPNSELSLREVELKLLWSRVRPDPYQVLTADSDFFLEGGNSLRLTKLQNEIKETVGVSVSIRQLYSAPTLRQMAARIGDEYVTNEDIDWDVETAIPDILLAAAETIPRHPRTPSNNNLQVLLTGAAMVLGNAVLHALIQNPTVAKIHCIAVTPDDEPQIPTSHEKIATCPGSLSSPALGLSPSEFAALQSRVDIVIHAGAAGHCLNSYSSVRRANVESTHFLAETLCLPRAVPLLYVLSQRVPAMAGLKVLPPVPVLAEPAKTGDTGYMASRWVGERFLHKLTEKLSEAENGGGFAVEVHRPCLFFGDRAPPSDALNGVLRYTRLMRTIPRFARVEGYVDVKNVDDIAGDIAASAINLASTTPSNTNSNSGSEGQGKAGIRYRHHSSGRKVTLEEWPGYMEELYREPFETLDLPDWIARAREHRIHPLTATYLEGLFPYLGEEAS
ncbi:Tenellin synthetase [Apiospora saccharicola]